MRRERFAGRARLDVAVVEAGGQIRRRGPQARFVNGLRLVTHFGQGDEVGVEGQRVKLHRLEVAQAGQLGGALQRRFAGGQAVNEAELHGLDAGVDLGPR